MKYNFNALIPKDKISIKNILRIVLFATIIFSAFTNGSFISQAMANSVTSDPDNNVSTTQSNTLSFIQFSNATSYTNQSATTQDTTSVVVTLSASTISSRGQVTVTTTITDPTNLQNIPTGIITWSDGNVGGTFSSPTCTLASGTCTTSYVPLANSTSNVTITARYGGDTTHQTNSGASNLAISTTDSTTLSVTSNPVTIPPGGSVNVTATVTDSTNSQNTPTSSVSWNDGSGGGTFDQTSCTLSSGSCTVSYTPSANPPNAVTITASYNGDTTHQTSTGSSQLSTNVLHPTTTTITPNPATFSAGTPVTFTATISDTTNPSSNMIGIVKWADNGAGGSFSPDACIISNNHCSLDYTPPSNPSGSIIITASYAGDSVHSESSATSSLSINIVSSQTTSQPNTSSSTTTQLPSTSKPTPTTQSNTSSPTSQSSSTTQSSASSNTKQSATQSQTITKSTTQSDSKTPTHPNETSTGVNHQPQGSPLTSISQAISKAVSELETLFQKL